MNPEIKEKWLTALRSGEYKQGVGYLRQVKPYGVEHCCLGVLCELAVKDGVVTLYKGEGPEGFAEPGGYVEYYNLPLFVGEWAGLHVGEFGEVETPSPVSVGGVLYSALDRLNDNAQLTFEEIADVIEEQF